MVVTIMRAIGVHGESLTLTVAREPDGIRARMRSLGTAEAEAIGRLYGTAGNAVAKYAAQFSRALPDPAERSSFDSAFNKACIADATLKGNFVLVAASEAP